MKLAVTSTGKGLDANLDPRFGRAAYFIIVDPETMAFEVVKNNQNLNLSQGAGIQAGKTIIDDAMTVFGGYGYFMEQDVERRYRDNRIGEFSTGPIEKSIL